MSDTAVVEAHEDPLRRASARLGRLLGIIGIVLVIGECAWASRVPVSVTLLSIMLTITVLSVQWWCLNRAIRSESKRMVWVLASYPARIMLFVILLYAPHLAGMDVRPAAIAAVATISASMICEVAVLANMRQFTVEAPGSAT
ncbi:hypothetical protein [Actinomyces mediterranea]|uniref:hypothetical protein n=1 Tax=Actinomyces mediterranea TaxID=1871028 RepID=UPI0009706400|nr:hypothetical protein [Actinomyces mediterranea]